VYPCLSIRTRAAIGGAIGGAIGAIAKVVRPGGFAINPTQSTAMSSNFLISVIAIAFFLMLHSVQVCTSPVVSMQVHTVMVGTSPVVSIQDHGVQVVILPSISLSSPWSKFTVSMLASPVVPMLHSFSDGTSPPVVLTVPNAVYFSNTSNASNASNVSAFSQCSTGDSGGDGWGGWPGHPPPPFLLVPPWWWWRGGAEWTTCLGGDGGRRPGYPPPPVLLEHMAHPSTDFSDLSELHIIALQNVFRVWGPTFSNWLQTIEFISHHNMFTNTIPRWGLDVSVPGIRSSTDVCYHDHHTSGPGLDTLFHAIAAASPGWFPRDTPHSTFSHSSGTAAHPRLLPHHSRAHVAIDGHVVNNIPRAELSLLPTTDTSIGSLSALQVYVVGRAVGQDKPQDLGDTGSLQRSSSPSGGKGGGGGGQDLQRAGSSGDKRKKEGDSGREEEEDEEVCFMCPNNRSTLKTGWSQCTTHEITTAAMNKSWCLHVRAGLMSLTREALNSKPSLQRTQQQH
jgi:hypothetical protein